MKYTIYTLTLGLIACAGNDEPVNLEIHEPLIVFADGGAQGRFTDFTRYNRPSLNVSDKLVFTNTTAEFGLQSSVRCENADKDSVDIELQVNNPKELVITELLPNETIDWRKEGLEFQCNFNFRATNKAGASHDFQWSDQAMAYDYLTQPLFYDSEMNFTEEDQLIPFVRLKDFYLKKRGYRNYQLLCDDLKITDLQTLNFDLPKENIEGLRYQNLTCRILEKHQWGGTENYSPQFYISPSSSGLRITPIEEQIIFRTFDKKHRLKSWDIHNFSSQDKYLNIELDRLDANIRYLGRADKPEAIVQFAEIPTSLVLSVANSPLILKPGETFRVHVYSPQKKNCYWNTSNGIIMYSENHHLIIKEFRSSSTTESLNQSLSMTRQAFPPELWSPALIIPYRYRGPQTQEVAPYPHNQKRNTHKNCQPRN